MKSDSRRGKRAVDVSNENRENSGEFGWRWGGEEVPIADQYAYLGVETSRNCSRDAHKGEGNEQG